MSDTTIRLDMALVAAALKGAEPVSFGMFRDADGKPLVMMICLDPSLKKEALEFVNGLLDKSGLRHKVRTLPEAKLREMGPPFWYFNMSEGQTHFVKQADQSDIDRCGLQENYSKDPNDYWVESADPGRGALLLKAHCEIVG